MTSNKPYLLRALYEWIVDNKKTPYLMVDATFPGVRVPEEHVEDGRIVLDIAEQAIKNLVINNSFVSFSARFDHDQFEIKTPVASVLAIFAQENGDGMTFNIDEKDRVAALASLGQDSDDEEGEGGDAGGVGPQVTGKPHLTIVD